MICGNAQDTRRIDRKWAGVIVADGSLLPLGSCNGRFRRILYYIGCRCRLVTATGACLPDTNGAIGRRRSEQPTIAIIAVGESDNRLVRPVAFVGH